MIYLTKPLHHAYCIAGNEKNVMPELLAELEQRVGFTAKGNPDLRQEHYDMMGIDDALTLKEAAERTAMSDGKKIFIVVVRGMTKEAQNALLKILEEPPKETYFFFVLPTIRILLPTLRSRLCEVLYITKQTPPKESMLLAKSFLKSAVSARLKTVQVLLKEMEERDEGKVRIFDFLDALEREAGEDTKGNAKVLSEILEVKRYSRDRAPSFKLLLEHLTLVLPKM